MSRLSLKSYFNLLWTLTDKEFRRHYKQAILGILWVFINPLLQTLIIGVVFSLFVKIPHYFLFLLSGLLPWQYFSQTISTATNSLVNERQLLQKTKFPRETIPLSIGMANYLQFMITLGILCVVVLIINPATTHLLTLIPAIIWLPVLALSLSLFTSALNVRYRDTSFLMQNLLTLWFYATPIIYTLDVIPTRWHLLTIANPLITPISLIHFALLNQPLPNLPVILGNGCITIVIICISLWTFRHENPWFTDWL